MVDIPRLHLLDDDDEQGEETRPLGIRTLRRSGGSVVVTIPPEVLDLVDVDSGDDVVVRATDDSTTLAALPDREEE
ncbi:MAG: hypothetical protein ABEJ81_00750 [Haloferacaceae archaeon]